MASRTSSDDVHPTSTVTATQTQSATARQKPTAVRVEAERSTAATRLNPKRGGWGQKASNCSLQQQQQAAARIVELGHRTGVVGGGVVLSETSLNDVSPCVASITDAVPSCSSIQSAAAWNELHARSQAKSAATPQLVCSAHPFLSSSSIIVQSH